jgi:hypothetical protein
MQSKEDHAGLLDKLKAYALLCTSYQLPRAF